MFLEKMPANASRQIAEALISGAIYPQRIEQHNQLGTEGRITVDFKINASPIADTSLKQLAQHLGKVQGARPDVEKVVYNNPATVVYWDDGTKTVVKCHEEDVYDERTGFLLCCAKKLFGNTGRFNNTMKTHVPEKSRPVSLLEATRNLLATVGL